jgi:glucosamine--fructose-6-phosphate aminotransferase (isomerizing)
VRYETTLSNLKQVKARSGRVIAVVIECDDEIQGAADHVMFIPRLPEMLLPILEVIPLLLLAYHVALRRGCDLAKSVTVE